MNMTPKKIVAANWKMNTLLPEALKLAAEIVSGTTKRPDVEKIIFPPFPYLKDISGLLSGKPGFASGAQNCSRFEKGAFTGEVAAQMIHSVGAGYVLVGHSERRMLFLETGEELFDKVRQVLQAGLKVIYCIGENLDERRNNHQFRRVEQQLADVFKNLPDTQTDRIVLAYEPVWAIGTGETASPQQAQDMHAFIRAQIGNWIGGEKAAGTTILYGGSCNAKNAKDLFACKDVDGGLIGGASLKAEEFSIIVNAI